MMPERRFMQLKKEEVGCRCAGTEGEEEGLLVLIEQNHHPPTTKKKKTKKRLLWRAVKEVKEGGIGAYPNIGR